MPKEHKEKGHKHSKRGREPAEYRLLTYAALGQQRKVAKLFERHSDLDVNFYDAHGNTALHQVSDSVALALGTLPVSHRRPSKNGMQASRTGQEATVTYLLRSVSHPL